MTTNDRIDRAVCLARGRRPWTDHEPLTGTRGVRITVKRVCNGCGHTLGDVTAAEIAAAADGLPMPDTRDECGCRTHLVCAQCLAPADTPSCCPAAGRIHLEMTERALAVFRHQETQPA